MYPSFKSKEIVFTCLLTFKGNRLKYLLIWYEVLLGKISPVRWLSLSNQIKLILSVDINSSNAMCLGRCSGSDFLCILASSSMIRWTVLSETLKRLPISFNDVLKAVSDKIICLTGCAIWQYSQTYLVLATKIELQDLHLYFWRFRLIYVGRNDNDGVTIIFLLNPFLTKWPARPQLRQRSICLVSIAK